MNDPQSGFATLSAAPTRIVKLDARTGALTVKGAEGRTIDLKVKDPSILKGYQAGDQVEGTFLQVLAIGDVGPAPAKK